MVCYKNNCEQINTLTQKIGNVRAWLKVSLLIGFTLCIIMVIGQYIFTAQIAELQEGIEALHLQIDNLNRDNKKCGN